MVKLKISGLLLLQNIYWTQIKENQPLFNSVQYPGLVAPKKTRQIAAVQASVQAGLQGPGALFSVYMQ